MSKVAVTPPDQSRSGANIKISPVAEATDSQPTGTTDIAEQAHVSDGEDSGDQPIPSSRAAVSLEVSSLAPELAKQQDGVVTGKVTRLREQPMQLSVFPHQPGTGKSSPPATIENVARLLWNYGITARYNLISKRCEISIPGYEGTIDNRENITMTRILSLAALNHLPSALIPAQVQAVADRNAYNPVEDWILSRPWDGVDRMPDFYATVVAEKSFPVEFKEALLRKWMLSAAAAALNKSGFRSRGVLTLQGAQGIGKTSWGRALVSDPILRDQVVLVDHHLDPGNKDSLLVASASWLVELGEIDSSFKRDIARLKGYLTSPSDKIRAPYARAASEYPRRTVFYATVNAKQFLVDDTGNSRWWTIPVASLDFRHTIDMQQVFAQLAVDLGHGAEWWLNAEEEATLERLNRPHRSVSVIRETLLEYIDLEPDAQVQIKRVTPIGLLREIGFKSPSNAQARECGAILREWLGESTKIRGEYKWPVPMRQEPAWSPHATSDDDY